MDGFLSGHKAHCDGKLLSLSLHGGEESLLRLHGSIVVSFLIGETELYRDPMLLYSLAIPLLSLKGRTDV